ncbi:ribonuclease H-like domain-containing protein [Tanacetum coccineum]
MTLESIQAMIDQALLRNSTNGDGSHSSDGDNRRPVQTWIEKMESVFHISGCAVENQVKFTTCTLLGAALTWWNGQIRTLGPNAYAMTWDVLKKKITDKYYPHGEIKKLEIELWNLKVNGNDVPTYTNRFQELALMCIKFVANEKEKVDKYISGLPDNIYGNVKSSKPKTLDETIELANDLMDQKLRTYAERQTDNKRKAADSSRNNHGHCWELYIPDLVPLVIYLVPLVIEVIQNENGPVSITTDTQGQIKVLPPRTAEEILARERERKARTTLLMALPEDHLAKFHKMTDAKEMWEAIKSRFCGNDESKKMQKYILKQQFEGFSVSNSEGLHKGYDRTKPGVDSLSFDDLYNNLRVFKSDVKGSTASSSSTQNVAFVAMISMRMKKFYKKTGRKLQFDANEPVGFDKTKVECYNCHKTGHFAREYRTKGNQDSRRKRDAWNSRNKDKENGRRSGKQEDSKALVTIDGEGVDWTSHLEEEEYYALIACNSSGSDTKVQSCSNECVAS